MTVKEIESYILTLDLAQKSIGFSKENKRHLMRIERLKEMLLCEFDGSEGYDYEKHAFSSSMLQSIYERLFSPECEPRCRVPGRPPSRFRELEQLKLKRHQEKFKRRGFVTSSPTP